MNAFKREKRFSFDSLRSFSIAALAEAGLPNDRATTVAETLIEADLMGHSTHGLALLPHYIDELESGGMSREGEPEIIRDTEATATWDGCYLPGPWLTHRAIDTGLKRLQNNPTFTITISRCHHIGSLASYPEQATKYGKVMLLMCSDPNCELVAPYGGLDAVYSPNPISAGIPTSGRPIIFDTSMSTTAMGVVARAKRQGASLPGRWMQDNQGNATADPNVVDTDPPGTILPMGGQDHGYKGYALGLLVEALTSALGGCGRESKPGRWGCSVFLQLIDPDAFGGTKAFTDEMDFLAKRCRDAKPKPGANRVRLPGERALELRDRQIQDGVFLAESIEHSLRILGERLGLRL